MSLKPSICRIGPLALGCLISLCHTLGAHGDGHERILELTQILETTPGDATSRLARASAYYGHSQFVETLEDLDKLPVEIATLESPALLRIRACLQVHRHREAENLVSALLKKQPGNLAVLRERARLRVFQEKPAEALADYDLVIAASAPPDPDLLLARARTAAQLDPSAALAWIDIQLGKTPLVALEEEAVSLCEKAKNTREAARRLDLMSARLPRPEFCLARKARILSDGGFASEAAAAWRECLRALDKLPEHLRSQPMVSQLRLTAETALQPKPSP